MTGPVRVIKLGGSLLDGAELPARLRTWMAAQSPAANLLIVGGGPLVDALRALDSAHRFSAETSHWLAIRAMGVTARLVAELVPEACFVDDAAKFWFDPAGPLSILDVESFLRAEQGREDALPASWDVTSDSIAARVAQVLEAAELVLLKSALPPEPMSLEQLAETGFVDAFFPIAAGCLRVVRLVNLRDPNFAETIALRESSR